MRDFRVRGISVNKNSQIMQSDMQIEKQVFGIYQEVEECVSQLNTQVEQHQINVFYNINNSVPRLVYGDYRKYNTVLRNLLLHAVELSEEGIINLEIDVASEEDDELEIITRIMDSGPGISFDSIKQLYEPERINNKIQSNLSHNDFGFNTTKELCGLMGGNLDVKNEKNNSSGFIFSVNFQRFHRNNQEQFLPVD